MQLKCDDRILHWIVAKVIMSKQGNYGRIDDFALRLMWLIKSIIKVNWPLYFCNRTMSYKLDTFKKLPYPSFLAEVLKDNEIHSANTLLTKPSTKSGLDKGVVNMTHYYQDNKNNWYYNDREGN